MRKTNYAVLANSPGLARVALKFDDVNRRLSITFPDGRRVEHGLDSEGRAALCQAVAHYMIGLPESPLKGHPEKLPLTLVGDLAAQRFHDTAAGRTTLYSAESLDAVADALGAAQVDGRRFRANVVIDGCDPWEELTWVGKRVRVGVGGRGLEFDVVKTVTRCIATHANPVTGERDHDVMNTLTRSFRQEAPTFAVSLLALGPGEVHLGDQVTVLS
jgi:hypothetical protein